MPNQSVIPFTGRNPAAGPSWRRYLIYAGLLTALTIWGLTDVRRRARVDDGSGIVHRTDLTLFTAAGTAFYSGSDAYSLSNSRGWQYPYPPLFALLVAPLDRLHPEHQALVWFAISLLMAWGCYYECRKLLSLFATWSGFGAASLPNWMYWAVGATVLLPTLNCLQRGQVGILKTWLLLWGFRLIAERRGWLRSLAGGIVLALPVALKVTPLLPVGLVVLQQLLPVAMRSRQRPLRPAMAVSLGTVLGAALFFFVLPALLIGWQANLRYLHDWRQRVVVLADRVDPKGQVDSPYTMRNQSLSNAVYRCGNWFAHQWLNGPDDTQVDRMDNPPGGLPMDAPVVATLLLAARCGAMLLLLALAWQVARVDDALGEAATFGMGCVATLIVSPIARVHYFMLLLPAVLFVPLWLLARGHARTAMAAAITPAALVVVHYLALEMAGRVGLLGIGVSLWYTLTITGMLVWRSPVKQSLRFPEANHLSLRRAA